MRLSERIAKGARDCGNHEFYPAEEGVWRCYHCEPGQTSENPYSDAERAAQRAALEAFRARHPLPPDAVVQ